MQTITLSAITIYPIKSAQGIAVSFARLEDRGLQYDRRWMLVQSNGIFLSQREIPRMALLHVQVKSDELTVNAPGMNELRISFHEEEGESISVSIWDDTVRAFTISEAINNWFSNVLGVACKFVCMRNESHRLVEAKYAIGNNQVSFADSFPLHLISEESLNDLNSRLEVPVSMNRFRPNLVIRGCKPYEEDMWRIIRIGSLKFHIVKPCARCTIPTVDQSTAERGKEPNHTLAQYRTFNNKVLFGQNLIQESNGMLRLGDEVEVIKYAAL